MRDTWQYDKVEVTTTRSIKVFYDLLNVGMLHIFVTAWSTAVMVGCAYFGDSKDADGNDNGHLDPSMCTLYRLLATMYIVLALITYPITAILYGKIFDEICSPDVVLLRPQIWVGV